MDLSCPNVALSVVPSPTCAEARCGVEVPRGWRLCAACFIAQYPIWSRHLCEFLFNLEEFKKHYHRRSNVEATFAMIKEKFGSSVSMRLPIAQVNEVLAKCIAHNLCSVVKAIFTAGLVPMFWPDTPTAQPSSQAISDDERGAP
jgi:hypothetical protein